MRPDGDATGTDTPGADTPPGLEAAFRAIGTEGRAGLKAAADATKAFRILASADISLARSAFGRTLAFTGVAIAFGASAWLLLMATLVLGLQRVGLPMLVSLLITALLSAAVTVAAGWFATRYFEHTRLQATRRQLARLGFGELADMMPSAGSHQSAEAAAEQLKQANAAEPIKKGLGVDVTAP